MSARRHSRFGRASSQFTKMQVPVPRLLSTVNCELPFSRTIGNCCPTSRTRSNMYHYITYPCRLADNFGVRRLAAAFTVDTGAPNELLGRNGSHRKSGSKLPHSKVSKDGYRKVAGTERRNPRTGLPGEEPGRTPRERPATTKAKRRADADWRCVSCAAKDSGWCAASSVP